MNQQDKKKIKFFLGFLCATTFILLSSCSTRQWVISGTKPLLENIELAFLYETDIELARQALPMTIKLAEGFYHYYPQSPYYSGKLCFLYAAYTFGFLDDTPYDDFAENGEQLLVNINQKYNRALKYGFLSLGKQIKGFERTALLNKEHRKEILTKLNSKHLETSFWLIFAWANIIFNNLDDPNLVIELEIIKDIAKKLLHIDANYLSGASYAILLAYYGGRSDNLGGDYQKSKRIYQQGNQYAKDKSLILDFVFLKYVTTRQYQPKAFHNTYENIVNYKVPPGNEMSLINSLIQKKAKHLHLKKDNVF